MLCQPIREWARQAIEGEGGESARRENNNALHHRRMSVGLIGVRCTVGKEYWQEPEWQLANEGYVSLFR